MATRNPSVQTRTQYGHYWGVYAAAGVLPNTAGFVAPVNKLQPLEAGDIAYVTGAGLYQCTAPGTAGLGDATWSAVAGAAGQDRFAPTHLVGNTAEGDSAVAYSAAGFNYYPDTGNCVQLAAALLAAAVAGGRVYVRRGLYDLGAVGSPVGPMAIAAGVVVQGEREATVVRAIGAGNQGVFTMADGSALEELQVEAPSDPASLGSIAMVLGTDRVTLSNVSFDMGTNATGALRQALRLVGTGAAARARLTNVNINCSNSTGGGSPTIGIGSSATVIAARGIQIQGGDQSIVLANSDARIEQLLATGWSTNGVLHTGTGSVSLETARLNSDALTATSAEGIVLGGSDHTLIDVDVVNTALQQNTGIRFSTTSSNHRLSGIRISGGWADGIVLGTTVGGTSTSNTTITNCRIEAGGYGIRAAEGTSGLVLAKNQITVTSGGSALVAAGVRIEGNGSVDNTIEGNRISVTDLANAAYCIQHSGNTSTIRGNECSLTTGLNAIDTTGERNIIEGNTVFVSGSTSGITVADGALYNIVNGNVVFTSDNPYVAEILVYGGEYGVVNSNVTVVASAAPAASAGIRLTAASSNSNCIGNTCRGSSIAPIVNDLGTANNVAQNVGAV